MIVYAYIAIGIFGLFFGSVTNELLSLGIRSEIVSIISKAVGAAVLGVGAVALQKGITLPPLRQREDLE